MEQDWGEIDDPDAPGTHRPDGRDRRRELLREVATDRAHDATFAAPHSREVVGDGLRASNAWAGAEEASGDNMRRVEVAGDGC